MLLTDDTRYRRLPLVYEILLVTTVLRQELYLVDCKSLPVTGPKCNRPINSSEKRRHINKLFPLTTYLLCKYFLFIDNKYNNEWMNGSFDTISRGLTG